MEKDEKNIIQDGLISILNTAYSAISHISKRNREILLWAMYIVGFAYFIVARSPLLREKFFVGPIQPMITRHILGMILIIVIAVFTMDGPLHRVDYRRPVIVLQILTGIGIIVISFLHPIGDGYRLFGLQLIFIFPCLYLVWNNRGDYENLIRPIAFSIIISGILFCFGTLLFAFKGRLVMEMTRCAGVMSNSNVFSLVGLEMVLSGLYLLVTEKKSWFRTIFTSVSIGMGLGIVLLGQMRIAIIAIITCCAVTLYYCLIQLNRRPTKEIVAHIIVGAILIALIADATTTMDNINQAAIEKKNQVEVEAVEETSPEDSGAGTNENVDMMIERFRSSEGDDISTYSSGRIRIWKSFSESLNLLGHDYNKEDAIALTGIPDLPYAHNIFLEIAYRCGVPVAVIAMLYYLLCGFICIGFLFRKSDDKQPYLLFPIICTITFALEALLDCAVLPFFQVEALVFYISVAMIIDKDLK